ncbi:MAG: YgjV family protein [Ruminococcaceae bacterium]|nr:YgjV family protein [Oscillospiraceae bacterium]
MNSIIPQIIGILAVAMFLLSYQQKKRTNIILFNVISRCLYILQYVLLGAFSGAVLDILGAAASVVAGKKHTPFLKKHLVVVIIAINALIVSAGIAIACINQSWLDLFSLAGVLLHTGAFWLSSEKIIRRLSLAGSPFWFVYNFMSRAYGSALGDLLTMGSILIAMLRYREKKSEKVS